MPRPAMSYDLSSLPLHRFAATLAGVNYVMIKQDLAGLNLLRRTGVSASWQVRRGTAKHLFEERVWERTGKMDIFPTEAGIALLRELHQTGRLTMKAGHVCS